MLLECRVSGRTLAQGGKRVSVLESFWVSLSSYNPHNQQYLCKIATGKRRCSEFKNSLFKNLNLRNKCKQVQSFLPIEWPTKYSEMVGTSLYVCTIPSAKIDGHGLQGIPCCYSVMSIVARAGMCPMLLTNCSIKPTSLLY